MTDWGTSRCARRPLARRRGEQWRKVKKRAQRRERGGRREENGRRRTQHRGDGGHREHGEEIVRRKEEERFLPTGSESSIHCGPMKGIGPVVPSRKALGINGMTDWG